MDKVAGAQRVRLLSQSAMEHQQSLPALQGARSIGVHLHGGDPAKGGPQLRQQRSPGTQAHGEGSRGGLFSRQRIAAVHAGVEHASLQQHLSPEAADMTLDSEADALRRQLGAQLAAQVIDPGTVGLGPSWFGSAPLLVGLPGRHTLLGSCHYMKLPSMPGAEKAGAGGEEQGSVAGLELPFG